MIKNLLAMQETQVWSLGQVDSPWEGTGSVSSVAQSCPTLWDPMDCSTPGFPVRHQLLELSQTQVHRVSDVIPSSHPLLSPSPAFNLSQHQGLLQWVSSSCHCMPWLVLKWVYYEEELNPTSMDFSFLSTVHNVRQLKKTHSLWLAQGLGDPQGSMV